MITVGEMVGVGAEAALSFVGEDGNGGSMLIRSEHIDVDSDAGGKWDLRELDLRESGAIH